jgi:serine phosphatase RsbU (regulator of sigma subunit)
VTRTTKRLLAIVGIGKLLNSTLNLDKILEIILDTAIKHLDADRGTVYLIDYEKKEIWSRVLQGESKVEIRLPIGKGIAGFVAKTGKKIIIKDAYQDPRFNPDFDKKSGYHTKTILCTPMKDRNKKKIGVFQIINKHKGQFNQDDIKFLDLLSGDACIAIENARLYKEAIEKERIDKELEVASSIQKMILPKEIPQVEGFEITGLNVPSKQVGGDYYDVVQLPNGHIALVIADVSGKSVPGALLVSILQASLRAYLEVSFELTKLVGKLNHIILNNSTADKFITFFICLLDPFQKTLTTVNAGHNPPLLVRDGKLTKLMNGGVALGCVEFDRYASEQYQLQSKDLLVLFTDGVTEATDANYDLYEDERLEKFVLDHSGSSAVELKDGIYQDVKKFVGDAEQSDDITMLILKTK